ncbi:putative bifunctional diguanylate cyclase/phosphodiesterase [Vulcanococcus limneticus]|uniref:putative bifunctional diguanylate cyclase/phosphodiesterase n=1 Tax=Vulcanococcus limneticus TaxID=2170428 RepID=UPI00398BD1E9
MAGPEAQLEVATAAQGVAGGAPCAFPSQAALYRHLLDLVDGACTIIDAVRGAIVDCNVTAHQQLGYTREQYLALPPSDLLADPAHDQAWVEAVKADLRKRGRLSFSTSLRHRNGTTLAVEVHLELVRCGGQKLLLAAARERFQLLRIKEQLELSNRQLLEAERLAQLGSWQLRSLHGPITWSPQIEQILEFPDSRRPQLRLYLARVHPDDRPALRQAIRQLVQGGRPLELEHRLKLAGGRRKVVVLRARIESGRRGQAVGVVGTLQDVTAASAVKEKLKHTAYRDGVTGLPNRAASHRHLEQLLRELPHTSNLATICLDIDDFQAINDSFGIAIGNRVLEETGRRLRKLLGPADWVARTGSDEFLVLSSRVHSIGEARSLAVELQRQLARPLPIQEHLAVTLAVTVGVSVWPEHAGDPLELLQRANTALTEAKQRGPRQLEVYSNLISARLLVRTQLEQELARAVDRDQLRLVFQPQTDGRGEVVGAEALLRWIDQRGQPQSPANFIPLAERTGLIHAIGQWVLEESFRQLAAWERQGLTLPLLSINLSSIQLQDPERSLGRFIHSCSQQHGIQPQRLEFELTETAIQRDAALVTEQMQELAGMGFKLALDDFGTGYSSLEVLHRLPLHKLKIDRCFIDPLVDRHTDRSIVAATIAMARQLGMTPLAEGVENAGQVELLLELGCELFQGFHFGGPMEAAELGRRLASQGT